MNLHDIKNIRQLLNNHPTISIIPHTSPDGDAIGSCLGLYHFLKAREYDVEIVSPKEVVNELREYTKKFMLKYEQIRGEL